MLQFLNGKKTYLGAAGLVGTALVGLHYGAIDPATAAIVLSSALSVVGLRDALGRYVDQVIRLIGKK